MIIIISIYFAIFSIIDYLKYDNPAIVYSKDNDGKTKFEFLIKDIILMFQLIDTTTLNSINTSFGYYQAYYSTMNSNNSIIGITPINIEKCELGKNIDMKYKDLANDEYTYGRKIEDFYCISAKDGDLPLFYYPNAGFSFITLNVIIKNNSLYTPEKIQSLIISENNLIDHYRKDDPISKSFIYQFTAAYNSIEYTKINYNFQYIKYESDDGLLYKNSKTLNGLSFSDITFYRYYNEGFDLKKNFEELNFSNIGSIGIAINKSNFDNYKRTYKRLQALLAEIMSIINLLIYIGSYLSNILCDKKMCKDIIEVLINKNIRHSLNRHYINSNNNININTLFKNDKKNEIFQNRNKINQKSTERIIAPDYLKKNEDSNFSKSTERRLPKINKLHKSYKTDKVLKKLNVCNILKSNLCCNDSKTKLINFCHNIIIEDMSIEKILERFYIIENLYYFLSSEERHKLMPIKNKRFKEIYKYIHEINNEIKKDIINYQKIEKNKKEETIIK